MATYVAQLCPQCGAPLPETTAAGRMYCAYCSTALVPRGGALRLRQVHPEDLPHPERARLWVGGRRYCLAGRVARGEAADVFLGTWDSRLGERVIVKVLREAPDRALFERGCEVLGALQVATNQGRDHFTRLLPEPVACGEARLGVEGTSGRAVVAVFRYAGGFVHTLVDVRRAYPNGVPPQASAWMWKRVVETLSWVHSTGHVHGAVLPEHLLVHARDHGLRLVGWSRAVRSGSSLPAVTSGRQAFYPAAAWSGQPVTATTDLAMSARTILWLLSGDPGRASPETPDGYGRLLQRVAAEGASDGWRLLEEIQDQATRAFGPPSYVPFSMPGWEEG